jgi:hypothetical protein
MGLETYTKHLEIIGKGRKRKSFHNNTQHNHFWASWNEFLRWILGGIEMNIVVETDKDSGLEEAYEMVF